MDFTKKNVSEIVDLLRNTATITSHHLEAFSKLEYESMREIVHALPIDDMYNGLWQAMIHSGQQARKKNNRAAAQGGFRLRAHKTARARAIGERLSRIRQQQQKKGQGRVYSTDHTTGHPKT